MTKVNILKLILIFCIVVLTTNLIYSADNILLKGKLINEIDGKPIGAEVTFEDQEGDKIKVTADKLSGMFEQLLKADHNYNVTFDSPEIIRKETSLKTDESKTYAEQSEEFKVVKMEAGNKIVALNVSDDGSSLSSAGISALNELKTLLRFNRSLYIDIVTESKELYLSLNNLFEDKKWRMYKRKVTLYDKAGYTKNNVSIEEGMDVVIIIDKVEDPFK
jgi:hypothetical protein